MCLKIFTFDFKILNEFKKILVSYWQALFYLNKKSATGHSKPKSKPLGREKLLSKLEC
jgi:hypothetical protein